MEMKVKQKLDATEMESGMTHTIEKTVENYMEACHMLDGVQNIAAGISGGPDSMCMLHILHRLREKYGYRLVAVHVHHGIRGQAADEDMEYVRQCCGKWGIEIRFFCCKVEEQAAKWHMSTEEAGRKIRYDCFSEVLKKLGGGKIAVAHNSEDSSETFLLNLFRGTGIRGLTGIRPVRQNVIRPVLCLKRMEIQEYLRENGIDYRTDATNDKDLYTRNKIRNRIMPYVYENINPKASEHIFQAAHALDEICEYMEKQADMVYQTSVCQGEEAYVVDIVKIIQYDRILQKMTYRKVILALVGKLKDITAAHVDMIMGLMAGETGKKIHLPYHIICEKQYNKVLIYRFRKCETHAFFCAEYNIQGLTEEKIEVLPEQKGAIRMKLVKNVRRNMKIQEKMYTKWLNYDILKNGFQIRTRRPGDYIVINRQGGRKKLKDYFINLKIPREEREHILLLAKGSEIFWIIGYRVSEDCRISENTENILEIEYLEGPADIRHTTENPNVLISEEV